MNKKVLIAKIISAHGIRGEVKMLLFCEDEKKIEKYKLFDGKDNEIKVKLSQKNKKSISSNSFGDLIVLAKIDGINDRNEAEKKRGLEIFTERENFTKTKKNEFYIVDLIGLSVVDLNSKKIGKVVNAANHGAGAILEISFTEDSLPKNYQKNESFSFRNEIFPEVNIEKGFIRIDLPEIIELKD